MKKFIASLTIALTASLSYADISSSGFRVNKVLPVSSFVITSQKSSFTIWREVCSEKNVEVSVYKVFATKNKDGVEKEFRDPVSSEYGFIGSNTCNSGYYSVRVPDSLPDGVYEYKPIASIKYIRKDGEMEDDLIVLPTERLEVVRGK